MNAVRSLPFIRPRIVVSQCLGFAAVRYNGAIIRDDFVQRLAALADIVEVCPEVAIGLGVPRDPIRMQRAAGSTIALVQPATGRDITTDMKRFASSFADGLDDVDGFILKGRSPSCGIGGVAIFADDGTDVDATGAGMFALSVLERFPLLPIEDEISLRDAIVRNHFLTRAFAFARLRDAMQAGTRARLVAFHTSYKYLLMVYDPQRMTSLGRIVADATITDNDAFQAYRNLLQSIMRAPPTRAGHANAIMHMFGYVSGADDGAWRAAFIEDIERYRAVDDDDHKETAEAIRQHLANTLLEMAHMQSISYLLAQTYFEPFPPELA